MKKQKMYLSGASYAQDIFTNKNFRAYTSDCAPYFCRQHFGGQYAFGVSLKENYTEVLSAFMSHDGKVLEVLSVAEGRLTELLEIIGSDDWYYESQLITAPSLPRSSFRG